MAIKNIIFDWTGTLSSEPRELYSMVMGTLTALGKEGIPYEKFQSEFDTKNPMRFYQKHAGVNEEEVKKVDKFSPDLLSKAPLYEGAKELLNELHKKGYHIAVLSKGDKKEDILRKLKSAGIDFVEVYTTPKDKTKEDYLTEVLGNNSYNPKETLLIGDQPKDISAGKKAGTKTAAVLYGISPESELDKIKPDYKIKRLNELLKIIK
jgi:phosphoglycolate phosphatase